MSDPTAPDQPAPDHRAPDHTAPDQPAPDHTAPDQPAPDPTAPCPAARGFVPALEGMRAYAAIGVLVTHVAFQTAAVDLPVIGPVLGRLDFAVALFFALSGFLLWRPYAAHARGRGPAPAPLAYYRSRAVRILPAYWVVVCVVLALLPEAGGGWRVWAANLTLTQVFAPLTLTAGLTQMWSLSVEVGFYLVLPLLAWAVARLRGPRARWRMPVILAACALSFVWVWLPVPHATGAAHDSWLPGYLPWFGAGVVLAEAVQISRGPAHRLARHPWLCAVVAVGAYLLATTPVAGPHELARLEPWQYNGKIALGAVFAFATVVPLVLGEPVRHRILAGPVAVTLGRWSYGIFIWHLAVLAAVFPVFSIAPFSGRFPFVLAVTIVLSVAVASVSYALVEEPVRDRWGGHATARASGSSGDRESRPERRSATPDAASPTATTATDAHH